MLSYEFGRQDNTGGGRFDLRIRAQCVKLEAGSPEECGTSTVQERQNYLHHPGRSASWWEWRWRLAVYLLWQLHAVPPQFHDAFNVVALVVCPAYILSYVSGPSLDTAFAMVLTAG